MKKTDYSNLIIFEDTRNKQGQHQLKNEYFAKNGIKVVRKKLDYGDYMLEGQPNISVDTKQNLLELALNMFTDRYRFEAELRKAHINGIKLYILIEQRFSSKEQLLKWHSPKDINGNSLTCINGADIYKRMQELCRFYKCAFRFCRKVDAGKHIVKLLLQE